MSLILNIALLVSATWYIHERGARTVAENLGLVELRRPAYDFYAEERFSDLPGSEVVVIGDSQVERGPWSELLNKPVAVRGQSGQLISEVTASAPAIVPPRAGTVIAWAGSNDAMGGHDPSRIEGEMSELLGAIADAAPDASLVVLSVPPIEWVDDVVIESTNIALRRAADSAGATFVDVTPTLDGLLVNDGTHISGAGYDAVADVLLSTPSVAEAF